MRLTAPPASGYWELPSLLTELGQPELANVASLEWEQQSFFRDLAQLIAARGTTELAPSPEWDTFVFKYGHRPVLAELNVRAYLARSDERAYVVDHDAFRHLVGSSLHSVFTPLHKSRRRLLASEHVNPTQGRNLIEKYILVPFGATCAVAVSDTSAFTSSGVNLWAGLFAFLLRLTNPASAVRAGAPILLRVKGALVHCTIVQLVQLYLWLSVGTGCRDKSTGETYVSQGGYLGVCCNITLALLAQSYCLDTFRLLVPDKYGLLSFDAQSGGDDVYTHYVGHPAQVSAAMNAVHDSLTAYVGSQKEFSTVFLTPGVTAATSHGLGLKFCKKELLVEVVELRPEGVVYKVSSQYGVPVLEDLFAPGPASVSAARREYGEFFRQAREATCRLPDAFQACEFLTTLYARSKLDPLKANIPLLVGTTNVALRVGVDYHERDGLFASHRAWELVDLVQPVPFSLSMVFNNTLSEKIRHLSSQDVLVLLRVPRGTAVDSVWVLKRERRKWCRRTEFEVAGALDDESVEMQELIGLLQ